MFHFSVMGNSNQATRLGIGDYIDLSAFYGQPLLFHNLHSENIQLLHGRRRAKRINGCKGICFGSRPTFVNEYIYIRINDTCSLPGALRFGFISEDPVLLKPSDLSSYVCPDLTNEQGYWAKAVPEACVQKGNVLFFRFTPDGNVMYGVDGNEKGVFFGRIQMNSPVWCLMDLYGSTLSVEFEDGMQICHSGMYIKPSTESWGESGHSNHNMNQKHLNTQPSAENFHLPSNSCSDTVRASSARTYLSTFSPERLMTGSEIFEAFEPMPFHISTLGRNIQLSLDRCVATRTQHEYCNGYVFTHRPLKPGEKLLIRIAAISIDYVGGLAFGMTSCNPMKIKQSDLPDDSDMLLDWPEYWVVHKDVYAKPETNDELGFHLLHTGEVNYIKNGCTVTTLMHVDCSLPLWAFFDIYGSTQKIESLGVSTTFKPSNNLPSDRSMLRMPATAGATYSSFGNPNCTPAKSSNSNCTPAKSSNSNFTPAKSSNSNCTPVKSSNSNCTPAKSSTFDCTPVTSSNQYSGLGDIITVPPTNMYSSMCQTIRILPRKDIPTVSPLDTLLDLAPSLPPPLIPIPDTNSKPPTKLIPPGRPPRKSVRKSLPPPPVPPSATMSSMGFKNIQDSTSQECVICMETAPNCALYTCGHMCMCYECARDIVDNQGALCPICRQPILDVIRIFRS